MKLKHHTDLKFQKEVETVQNEVLEHKVRLKVSHDLALDQTLSVGSGKCQDPDAGNKYWSK